MVVETAQNFWVKYIVNSVNNDHKESGWIKFARFVIYLVSTVSVVIGASLIKAGSLSSSYADGTSTMKIHVGQILFYASLFVLCANIIWGTLRWFLRGSRENWRAGQIIGKLIGGGIWRILLFIPLILISAIFITPKIEQLLKAQTEQNEVPIVLSENYDRLQYIYDNLDTLDYDEIKDELEWRLFANIDFEVDASSNASTKNSAFSSSAYAYNHTVTKLNKATLSDGGHFVVYYTDTGDDKISDESAAKLSNMLEEIISGYQANLGFEYRYDRVINNPSTVQRMERVLENSGIDRDALDYAMPVYVANPSKTDHTRLANYAGRKFRNLANSLGIAIAALFGNEMATFYSTTPSYPFINILPENLDSESLPVVTAHELGHHYAANYVEDNYEGEASNDDFIDETAPNWMAINILPNQPQENAINDSHYNKWYLSSSTSDSINRASIVKGVTGYPAVAFLENYYEIVPNAKTIIMDAIYYGDALNYLYTHAGEENFKNVMMTLAERNLTGDYDGKLVNMSTPVGDSLNCAEVCSRTFEIQPASTKYVYFSTSEYRDVAISFSSDNLEGSLLGKTLNGEWKIIKSRMTEMTFTVDQNVAKDFEILAFVVANHSIIDSDKYTVGVTKTALQDILADEGGFELDKYIFLDYYTDLGGGCYGIDTNAVFDNLTEFTRLGVDFANSLTRLGEALKPGTDYSSVRSEYQKTAEEAKTAFSDAKDAFAPYQVTICENHVKKDSDFETVKSRLQTALGGTINIINDQNGDDKFSVFLGFDVFARTGRIYVLAQLDGEMGFITVNIAEK